MVSAGRLGERARRRGFIMISAIILLPVLIFVLWKTGGISSEDKNAIKQAGENLKLAQLHLNQSNLKDARPLLQASLANLTSISDKKAEGIKQQINQTLDDLNRTSDKRPVLFTDPTIQNENFTANIIAVLDDRVNTTNTDGVVSTVTQSEISQLGQFEISPQFIFSTSYKAASAAVGSGSFRK